MLSKLMTNRVASARHPAHIKRLKAWLREERKKGIHARGFRQATRSRDGVWTFWKVTSSTFKSPYYTFTSESVNYTPGRSPRMAQSKCDSSAYIECGTGLHLWPFLPSAFFARQWHDRARIVQVEVQEKDIVAVPHSTYPQKLRVCRMKVIKEVFPKRLQAAQRKKAQKEGK